MVEPWRGFLPPWLKTPSKRVVFVVSVEKDFKEGLDAGKCFLLDGVSIKVNTRPVSSRLTNKTV